MLVIFSVTSTSNFSKILLSNKVHIYISRFGLQHLKNCSPQGFCGSGVVQGAELGLCNSEFWSICFLIDNGQPFYGQGLSAGVENLLRPLDSIFHILMEIVLKVSCTTFPKSMFIVPYGSRTNTAHAASWQQEEVTFLQVQEKNWLSPGCALFTCSVPV